jgi:hypothetical protein
MSARTQEDRMAETGSADMEFSETKTRSAMGSRE